MRRTVLLIPACLLLALRTVAQAPEKVAPDDLVVTAEIVGYSKSIYAEEIGPALWIEMKVRNTTDHMRDISMMSCSWGESWLIRNQEGISEAELIFSCTKNVPTTVSISAGETLIFSCPFALRNGHFNMFNHTKNEQAFSLGFLDYSVDGVWHMPHHKNTRKRITAKTKQAQNIYWSNPVTATIDITTLKPVGSNQYAIYHLTANSK